MNRACTCYFIVIVLTIEFYLGNAFSQGHLPKNKRGVKILLRTAETDINEEPITTIERIVEEEDDEQRDELVDSVTKKLEEMSGLWYSDDFYGPHGREWIKVSATVVGEMATSALEATKVTGDPHVPAGCVTFRTSQWPSVGEKVPAQIQVRADPNDPNGFSWLPGDLTLVESNQIRLMCQYNILMRSEGTFYREKNEEEE